jgi:protease-4
MDSTSPPPLTRRQQFLAVALAAVVIGAVLAPTVYGASNSPDGTVAVVTIEGPVVGSTAENVEDELREIRQNDSVEAVVLKLDTPGGAPAASERMYTSVQRTSQEMPVIASVQSISASGGYYAMAPADEIYVLPTSITGSVGLAARAPEASEPVQGPSGPDKRGTNPIEQWATQETLADVFIQTVMQQRGDRIDLSREEVAEADVYLGVRAVENGFADRIGDVDEAIAEAADRAGLDDYAVDERDTSADLFPFLFQTDQGLVVVHDQNPGYGEVETLEYAFVHREAVPHVETVDRVTRPEVRALTNQSGTAATASGGDPS